MGLQASFGYVVQVKRKAAPEFGRQAWSLAIHE
jgi:hypothetical protein